MADREVVVRWRLERDPSNAATARAMRQEVERELARTGVGGNGNGYSSPTIQSPDVARRQRIADFEAELRELNSRRRAADTQYNREAAADRRSGDSLTTRMAQADIAIARERSRQTALFNRMDAENLREQNARTIAGLRDQERDAAAAERAQVAAARNAERAQREHTREVNATSMAYSRLGTSAMTVAHGVALLAAGRQGMEQLVQSVVMIQGAVDIGRGVFGHGGMLRSLAVLGIPMGVSLPLVGVAAGVGAAAYGGYQLGTYGPRREAEASEQRWQQGLAFRRQADEHFTRINALDQLEVTTQRDKERALDDLRTPSYAELQRRAAESGRRVAESTRALDRYTSGADPPPTVSQREKLKVEYPWWGFALLSSKRKQDRISRMGIEGMSEAEVRALPFAEREAAYESGYYTRTGTRPDKEGPFLRAREDRENYISDLRAQYRGAEDRLSNVRDYWESRIERGMAREAWARGTQTELALMDPMQRAHMEWIFRRGVGGSSRQEVASLLPLLPESLRNQWEKQSRDKWGGDSELSKAIAAERKEGADTAQEAIRKLGEAAGKTAEEQKPLLEQIKQTTAALQKMNKAAKEFQIQTQNVTIATQGVNVSGTTVNVAQGGEPDTAFNFQAQQMRGIV